MKRRSYCEAFFFLFAFAWSSVIQAQVITMTNGTTTNGCTGTFYDSGGAGGNYGNNETIVHTFCPDDPTICMWFDFSSFNTQVPLIGTGDVLNVYDGASTASQLLQTISGDFGAFDFPVGSSTGCTTFEFISNGSNNAAGWMGEITCVPCPRAQSVNEGDCINSIPVCQEAYFQPYTYTGVGNYPSEINEGSSCLEDGEENGVWYIFTISQSGNLNFTIHPLLPEDDYDWSIWDLTGRKCPEIFTEDAPVISCNYSNSNDAFGMPVDYGITGANSNPPFNGTANTASNTGDPQNASIPVIQGNTYVMYISNSDNATAQNGYYLDFRDSDAILFDNDAPEITGWDPPMCNDLNVTIYLSEPVLCSSIQNGDIEIFNPSGLENYTASTTGAGCADASFTTEINLTIFPRIEYTGTYTIVLSGELEDNCGNIGTGSSFTDDVLTIPVDAGPDYTFCAGTDPGITLGGSPTAPGGSTYSWSSNPGPAVAFLDNSTSANPGFSNPTTIPPGTYIYKVEAVNSLNCRNLQETVTITVTSCTCTIGTTPGSTGTTCNGGTDGSISLSTTGGSTPYSFIWNNGETSSTINNLSSGNYCYTVSDVANCSVTGCANVPQPSIISFTTTQTAPSCSLNDGSITVDFVSGGTAGYTYDFGSGFSPSNTAGGFGAGNYPVIVSDNSGCTVSSLVSLTNPAGPSATSVVTDANCGACDGAIDLSITGGSAPFSYNWENSNNPGTSIASTEDISSLCVGNYCVTVTDAANCVVATCATVNTTNAPSIVNFTTTEEHCGMANGTALVNLATPGTYSYAWEDAFNLGTIVSTTNPATGLVSTTYNITVSNTDGSCPQIASIGVSTTNSPIINTITATPATCGNTNGTATASVSSGSTPYTFNWAEASAPSTTISTMISATGLAAGTYNFTVTDDVGCSDTDFVNIISNGGLTLTATPASNFVTCNGGSDGSINLEVSGGSIPYSYNWSGPGGPYITEDLSGIPAGTYAVTVTDNIGCTGNANVSILDPQPLIAAGNPTSPSCFGSSDGSIATFAFGEAPFSFAWDNGVPPVQNPTNLTAGTYNLTVTDNYGCTLITVVIVNDPPQILLNATGEVVTCVGSSDGDIALTVTDGVPPYTYAWSNGPMTQNQSNLGAGDYFVTVTDTDGCSSTASASITEPTALGTSIAIMHLTCNGSDNGALTASTSGGAGNYSYNWSNAPSIPNPINLPAGIYTVTVTDMSGCTTTASAEILTPDVVVVTVDNIGDDFCNNNNGTATVSVTGGTVATDYNYNWSVTPPQNSPTVTGLTPGTYTLQVTDDNACFATASVLIGSSSPTIVANETVIPVGCQNPTGGSILLNPSGGTAPYTYFWTNFGTVNPAENVPASSHFVQITDANGCTANVNISVGNYYVTLNQVQSTPTTCFGGSDGSLTLTAGGDGMAPFTYTWPHDPMLTTNTATGLTNGDYEVTVTDDSGCFAVENFTIDSPIELIVDATVVEHVTCFGSGDGIASAQAYGGQGPYGYLWPTSGETTGTAFSLGGGIHQVIVTDANGCTASGSVDIIESTAMTASATATDAICGLAEGSVSGQGTGGLAPYTYDWGALGMGQTINNVPPGSYTVIVTDTNGCTRNATVTVGGPIPVTPVVTTQPVTCFGDFNGIAYATVSGGAGSYTYQWDNGEVTNPAIFLQGGAHTLTVLDSESCPGIVTFTVGSPEQFSPFITVEQVSCRGGNDGSATLILSGGTPPYFYTWSSNPPQYTATATDLTTGNYAVTVIDDEGCKMNPVNVFIPEPTQDLAVDMSNAQNPVCFEGEDGFVAAIPTGGTPSYTYLWNNGNTNSSLLNVGAGNYSVTITDLNGCTQIGNQILTQPMPIVFQTAVVEPFCFGFDDGNIAIPTVSGGAGSPFLYSLDGEIFQMDTIFRGLEAGVYDVYVQDALQCSAQQTITVGQPDELIIDAGEDTTIQLGESYDIETTVSTTDSLFYDWINENGDSSMSCTICPDPMVMPVESNVYLVTATDEEGCEAQDQITITVDKERRVFIPNAFTPNNDGNNDAFYVYAGLGVTQVRVFRVFDRWGELMHEALNVAPGQPEFGWNGTLKSKEMKPAVFVYYAEVEFADGEVREYKGDVTLMR